MQNRALSAAIHRLGWAALGNTHDATDGRVLARFIQSRDEAAFGELVRRLGPMVLGVCRRVSGDAHLADDAFQATFLVLARRAAEVPPEAVRGWLYGVAVRTAREARSVSARRRARELPVATPPDRPVNSPEAPDADALRVLDEEIAALPEHLRAAVVLCELDGASRKVAADRLGIPEGTVRSRLAKARKVLAARLWRRGVTLPAAALAALGNASAAVPPQLASSAIALAVASTPVPPAVAILMHGVFRSMFLKKLTISATCGLVFAVACLAARTTLPTAAAAFALQAPISNAADPAPGTDDRPQGGPRWELQAVLEGHKDEVVRLAFGVDQLATASKDGSIKLWDISKAKEQRAIRYAAELGPTRSMSITPDGKHALLIFGEHLGFWELSKDTFPKATIGGAAPVAFTSASDAYRVVLRRTQEREDAKKLQIWTVSGFGSRNGELGFGPFESTGFFNHGSDVETVCLSEDAEILAAATADSTITLWTADKGKERAVCKGHTGGVLDVEISLDRKTLASAGKDGTVRLWDTTTGKELAVLKGHEGPVNCVAFDPEGKTLAAGGDKLTTVWDVATAKQVAALTGHTGAVLHVAFSRDGRILASGGRDTTVRLWSLGN
jgi:RNA polymerase sigma factor (sigma-70 family)